MDLGDLTSKKATRNEMVLHWNILIKSNKG